MNHEDARRIIDELSNARTAIDAATVERDMLIDSLLTLEQKAQIREIRDEFDERIDAARATAELMEAQAKAAVKEIGESVKGERMTAVWSKPQVTWDGDGLLAMAKNPEFVWLKEFMKCGEPRISIRTRS